MTHYDVKRLGLILALQAEIEGMKATNLIRQTKSRSIPYDLSDFEKMSMKLRRIATCENYQLSYPEDHD